MLETSQSGRSHQPAQDITGLEIASGVTSVSQALVNQRLMDLSDLLPAMQRFFSETPSAEIARYTRTEMAVPQGRDYIMPARVGRYDGLKWISSRPANTDHGLERSQSVMMVKEAETGRFLHSIPGADLTPTKTALVTMTALSEWLRVVEPANIRLGIIGGGGVSKAHLRGIYQTFGSMIDSAMVFSPRSSGAQLVGELGLTYPCTLVEKDQIFDTCNVIISSTTASDAVITPMDLADRNDPLFVAGVGFYDLHPQLVQMAVNMFSEDPLSYTNTAYPVARALSEQSGILLHGLSEILQGRVSLEGHGLSIFTPFGTAMADLVVSLSILGIEDPYQL